MHYADLTFMAVKLEIPMYSNKIIKIPNKDHSIKLNGKNIFLDKIFTVK